MYLSNAGASITAVGTTATVLMRPTVSIGSFYRNILSGAENTAGRPECHP
jgi:hypothetical protein